MWWFVMRRKRIANRINFLCTFCWQSLFVVAHKLSYCHECFGNVFGVKRFVEIIYQGQSTMDSEYLVLKSFIKIRFRKMLTDWTKSDQSRFRGITISIIFRLCRHWATTKSFRIRLCRSTNQTFRHFNFKPAA